MNLSDLSLSSLSFSARGTKPRAWKTHVYVEWFVVLFASTVFLVSIALWSSFLYGATIDRLGVEGGVASEASIVSVDKNTLTVTLKHFEWKRESYDALKRERPVYRDPSL